MQYIIPMQNLLSMINNELFKLVLFALELALALASVLSWWKWCAAVPAGEMAHPVLGAGLASLTVTGTKEIGPSPDGLVRHRESRARTWFTLDSCPTGGTSWR